MSLLPKARFHGLDYRGLYFQNLGQANATGPPDGFGLCFLTIFLNTVNTDCLLHCRPEPWHIETLL